MEVNKNKNLVGQKTGLFFSCLESSFSSEALDSFGWRSAVFLFTPPPISVYFHLQPLSTVYHRTFVSSLASTEAICTLLYSFLSFFGF